MNSKSAIALIVIILIVGVGGYLFTHQTKTAVDDTQVQQGQMNTNDGSSGGWNLMASFACDDGSAFIAGFPQADQVDISIDNTVVRTVPAVAGAGQRFENGDYTYIFAGEEATVITKQSNATTVCTQPSDENNAPVNFGDAEEGGGLQDPALAAGSLIVGTWQSTDDPQFVREFKNGGVVSDTYNGSVTATDNFFLFTDVNPAPVSFPIEKGVVYLQMISQEDQSELNFKVNSITPDELQLTYLDRGGVLTFKRIP